MADISLTQGQVAKVDENIYPQVAKFKWFAYWNRTSRSFYAGRMIRNEDGSRYMVLMHREVMGAARGESPVDHINGDTLDNRKSNLRFASIKENCRNRRRNSNNTSGVSGVLFNKKRGKWEASIRVNFKLLFLGRFDNMEEAVAARKGAEVQHFGEFAPNGRK